MRSLSQIILLLILSANIYAQSPHGSQLKLACSDCHTPNGWKLEKGAYTFNHNSTKFPLIGLHDGLECKMCHPTLVFNDAKTECISCHTDVHYQSVGMECDRCHTPKSWLVNNITEIHRQSRFPLVGPHLTADCYSCHPSASLLNFQPLGVECIDCHRQDYLTAKEPNHVEGNFSTNCEECHSMNSFTWGNAGFNHAFFPLTEGHSNVSCTECHKTPDYSQTSPVCVTCHQEDYNSTSNPNHIQADISANCSECHTTSPGWSPAEFKLHDGQYFPIYSGSHKGTWNNCTDCHNDPNNFATNSCIVCHDHNQQDMDDEHKEVGGYIYSSAACFECHPTGNAEDGFNHNLSNFPLTGAHITTDCIDCHLNGYAGTTTICGDCHIEAYNQSTNPNHTADNISIECADCHTTDPGWAPAKFDTHNDYYPLTGGHATVSNDCFACHAGDYNNTPTVCMECHTDNYNQTSNPNHNAIGIDNVCELCHTTAPEWKPASFPTHNNYYELTGAHAAIANDCFTCHQGDYNTTPNTCFACHTTDYNQTNNPPHQAAQFPTDCETCHNQNAWVPSTFEHDAQYFPIYSGKHDNTWTLCSECHTNSGDYGLFTCLTCHQQTETNNEHEGMSGYQYNSDACYACHPDGNAGDFNHNNTNFPLTGAHTTVDCMLCHENGFGGTSTICSDCHQSDFNQSTNPNHTALSIPNECATCHTTNPNWNPATFPIHNNYYVLEGAHIAISGDCFTCHNGDYNNTQSTCYGCHQTDYEQTSNPPHESAQFPTDCEACHTQSVWIPSTFEHDAQYFPIYSGKHNNTWNLCSECHNDPMNYSVFTCLTCHQQTETNNEHEGVGGYSYNSEACYSCHPTGNADDFNHNNTNFPLTGAHTTVDCILCHEDGYSGTSTICSDCHQTDYDQTNNPNHINLSLPIVCDDCHTTNPDWNPATFNIHNDYYTLDGGHLSANCADCHNGDYNNTPTICFDCHTDNYNETTNPDHLEIDIPNVCDDCHTTNPGWNPATFDIHNDYYVLDGAHLTIVCADCHNGDYNNTPNGCFGCHSTDYNQSSNPDHIELNIPDVCAECHTTNPGWNPATFDIHDNYYVLAGAHLTIADQCATCHNGDYNNTPNTCYGCHQTDYNQTTDPNHSVAQFPTDCELCHTQSTWTPSTFDHDSQYFPIYSGTHHEAWDQCIDCHTNPSNYAEFTCITCHTQSETNQDHQEVSGYQYESNACYSCHPNGNSGGKMMKKLVEPSKI